jgi:PAS domain S-box-containing protein
MIATPYAGPIDRSLHEILVVDDNPASRYATARLLRSVGFRTREAATGGDALQQADESISAVVLDVHLPDIDGFETCRVLRTRSGLARLPVLHLSAAYVTDDDKVRGLDAGADAYLTHPVEPAVLVATVQALVRARMAEDAMRRSEAQFRALYAQAPGGICVLDGEGRLTDANPALLATLRCEADAVVGHRLSDFAPAEWVERVDQFAGQTAHGAWHATFPMRAADGQLRHIEWRVSAPLEPGVSIAVASDVSEQMSVEATRRDLLLREQAARVEAERVSRLKDDLIAVLSHELRTPLNAIMGWTHVLQKRITAPEAQRGLQAIERNGKMQARLILDILDVSSINMGKLHLQLEPADPVALLSESLEALQPVLEQNGNTLALEIGPGANRPLLLDAGRFQQIVWNLASNAVKFSKPGGEVRISLQHTAQGTRLSVADQGQGIEPEFLPHLFDRFSQGNAERNRLHGGLGLGLSIVKHLVQLHGGQVAARSAGAGQGAVFEVDFPSADTSLAATVGTADDADSSWAELPEAARAADALKGLNVLVVDDDPEARAMLSVVLSDRGASVAVAAHYEEALQHLQRFSPDVLVCDIGMPGHDGHELLREIRLLEAGGDRHLPAIALTAFTRQQDVAQALAAGFDRHVSKPLRPLELVREIAALGAAR